MVIVYGADWCEDTRRSRRHLRRLGMPHEYINIDEDLEALARAKALNGGQRRTPIIDLGFGGAPLVEPDNDELTAALVERDMLSDRDAVERVAAQNVGDLERVLRMIGGMTLMLAGRGIGRTARWPLTVLGTVMGLSGLTGWCPVYHAAGITSIDGPGDRPDEADRDGWLAPRRSVSLSAVTSAVPERAAPASRTRQ